MSVRLFVLGILKERPAHGYSVIETARRWQLERWSNISFSSIYHALRSLERDGLAEEVQREAGPSPYLRTIYRITPEGNRTFAALMRDTAVEIGAAKDPLFLMLGFMNALSRSRRAGLLRERRTALEGHIEGAKAKIAYLETNQGDPWALAAARLCHRQLSVEMEWLRELQGESDA